MERAVLSFCGVTLPWLFAESPKVASHAKQQAIGQFCGGSCVTECTAIFGDGLAHACRTCPN
jgi:hypothetical protein